MAFRKFFSICILVLFVAAATGNPVNNEDLADIFYEEEFAKEDELWVKPVIATELSLKQEENQACVDKIAKVCAKYAGAWGDVANCAKENFVLCKPE